MGHRFPRSTSGPERASPSSGPGAHRATAASIASAASAASAGMLNEPIPLGDGRRARLLGIVGRGASSTTYRALLESPTGVRRLVAVKLFATVSTDDADEVFGLAARAAIRAASVRHPNIVETYDYGVVHTQPFFVNELVEGVSLAALLERYAERGRRLPLDLALFIAAEVAEALSGARTARDHRGVQIGMLHRGLGTRKVLLGWRGEVKVSDFDTKVVAAASSGVRSLRTVAHRSTGMAPEVAQGHEGDARSDVFSLGVLMRELLVGPRFARDVSNAQAVRLARDGFVQPMSFQPHLPDELVHVMVRALEVAPDARYPNATAMAFDLRRLALAMGVGDGRLFLHRLMEREWGDAAAEVTAERPPVQPSGVTSIVSRAEPEPIEPEPD